MKLAKAEKATVPRSKLAKIVAWVYAAVLVIMLIAQLYAFEKFLPLMNNYELPGGNGTASLVACLIVFTEVFSVPFLLRMPLSPLMRWFSLLCSVLVPIIWLKLSVSALMTSAVMVNSGMLGEKVVVHTGPVQFVVSLGLFVLALWAVSGLWPVRKK